MCNVKKVSCAIRCMYSAMVKLVIPNPMKRKSNAPRRVRGLGAFGASFRSPNKRFDVDFELYLTAFTCPSNDEMAIQYTFRS